MFRDRRAVKTEPQSFGCNVLTQVAEISMMYGMIPDSQM